MLAMSATTDVSVFYCTEGMTRLRGEGENFPDFFLVFRRFLLHRRVARIFNNKLRRFLQLHIGRFSNVYRINSYRRKILEFFTLSVFLTVCSKTFVFSSVADPERFDADLDPTFQADADPDPKMF